MQLRQKGTGFNKDRERNKNLNIKIFISRMSNDAQKDADWNEDFIAKIWILHISKLSVS
jgi:hypothetical protein